jgi:hypothetical protein
MTRPTGMETTRTWTARNTLVIGQKTDRMGKAKKIGFDGAQYEGDYMMGKKHGHGTFIWSDGSSYNG